MYTRQQCPTGYVPYMIREGDTIDQIAKLYNTSSNDILVANPGIDPNRLTIGEELCVPLHIQYYPSCRTTNYYVVGEEDSFNSIADYFNVTTDQLYYSNFGIDPDFLYEDQILCIPVTSPPVSVTIDIFNRLLTVIKANNDILKRYPIQLANANISIPRGNFTILNKQVDPGVEEGARWLGLSQAGLGIRGVNTPLFIEKLSTDKSIVLSNQDISELFNLVTVGTNILIT